MSDLTDRLRGIYKVNGDLRADMGSRTYPRPEDAIIQEAANRIDELEAIVESQEVTIETIKALIDSGSPITIICIKDVLAEALED